MILTERGVVLKNYLPNRHRVAILNDRGESIDALAIRPAIIEKLRPGYVIEYNLEADSLRVAKILTLEIVLVPKKLSYESLQFLYQVLELCVQIIPEGQISLEGSLMVKYLIQSDINSWSAARRRLYICRLLSVLGFYPDLIHDKYDEIYQIGQINRLMLTDFMKFEIDNKIDNLLINWVANFISVNIPPRLVALFASVYQK